jgi:hypothetical protein
MRVKAQILLPGTGKRDYRNTMHRNMATTDSVG